MFGDNRSLILVIDDVADDRFVTRMNLEHHRFSVVEAGNWDDAVKELTQDSPSLVVLDVNMCRLDGVKLLEMIRSNKAYRTLPVILYTSTTYSLSRREELEKKGASAVVKKSDHPDVLIEKIRQLLNKGVSATQGSTA